ncbi:MAG: zinc-ribbon domain-containing protein [Gemmatimonadales bacterium]
MNCHACGAALSPTSRFCHKCGAAVAATGATGWRVGLPWGLAGAALGALVTVLAMWGAGSEEPGAARSASGSLPPAPDISQMSPQERANRLFNRIMILSEARQTDSVQFFLPMALGAYGMLPSLDADARYHLGLIHLAAGQPAAALAQADTIARAVPTHLFAFVLRARAFADQGDTVRERRAYADFLRHQDAELARARPEYAEHRELTAFAAEAQRRAPAPP